MKIVRFIHWFGERKFLFFSMETFRLRRYVSLYVLKSASNVNIWGVVIRIFDVH